jgi:hypothetical protein
MGIMLLLDKMNPGNVSFVKEFMKILQQESFIVCLQLDNS